MSVHKYKSYSLKKREPTFWEQLEALLLVVWHIKALILFIILLVVLGFMIPARLLGY